MASLRKLLFALPAVIAQTSLQPPGTPYPETTYPNATDPAAIPGAKFNQTSPPSYPSPWGAGIGNWTQAYAQARAFVATLTLTEKVNLTTGVGWEMEKCVGNTGSIPRVGFAALCLEDSPLGVRDTDFNSAFSAGVTAAASWSRSLINQRGIDMGAEHRDKGTDIQLGPVVGPIGRAPEGGRNWEGFSPDPVLSAVAVAETIQGIQSSGVMACTKHFIGNEQEHFRQATPPEADQAASSNIDDTTMHELYLWPFAAAVRAGTAAVMCSYNQVNNSYASQNSYTLNHLLKNELGFQGFVMSDWSAQVSGVASALAGLDMTMPGDQSFDSGDAFWGANLTIAVLNGTIPEWRIDDMATRIMAAYYYVDRPSNLVSNAPTFSAWTTDTNSYQHFWSSQGFTQVNYHVNVQGNHYQGIREIAAAGTVLLKNDNAALPLTGTEALIGIFGSDAGENLWGPNGDPDRGGDNGTLAMGWGSGTANFPYLITPLEAIKAEVRANQGAVESVLDDYAYDQAYTLARRIGQPGVGGACIVFGNSDSGEGYLDIFGNAGDRNNLTLWHNTEKMISTVAAQCPRTIVVIHSTGPVLLDNFYKHPNVTGIIWAGIPGQESGNSITDILYGKVNPGGKTPFTWGEARGSYSADLLYINNNGHAAPQLDFEEGPFIDYFAFDKFNVKPIYEFGFGLSYTNFTFSNLEITTANGITPYTPNTGNTPAAPTYGTSSTNPREYLCDPDDTRITNYIYPCLNSTSLKKASGDSSYGEHIKYPTGARNGNPQPYLRSGSKTQPGGNEQLYDTIFTITASITNTGSVVGDEVPQLYVSLGGKNAPVRQLRDFDRITVQAGQTATFTGTLTRKDLSNWNTDIQDWEITKDAKTIYVGNSSRNLPLTANLNIPSGAYPVGTSPPPPAQVSNGNTQTAASNTQTATGQSTSTATA